MRLCPVIYRDLIHKSKIQNLRLCAGVAAALVASVAALWRAMVLTMIA